MSDRMTELALAVPSHLRWDLDLTSTSGLAHTDRVVLLGMGGSGMAAEVATLTVDQPVVTEVHADYGLPIWVVPRRATVVAVTYSGNTEETVSGLEEALGADLPVVVVTTGGRAAELAAARDVPVVTVPEGLQPRAALGYTSAAVASVLAAIGASTNAAGDIAEAADVAERMLGGGEGAGYHLGVDLAEGLAHTVPVMLGASPPARLAARRWATQLHENAKRAAFFAEIPEMNHNALEAWATRGSDPARLGVVALEDPAGDDRNARRLDLTMRRLGGAIASAGVVTAQGSSPFARFWSLATVGDVVSLALAEKAGVDPEPVDVLESFKLVLREE